MKKIFIILTVVWFGVILNSFSADLQKGLDAANSGDYTTAFKELRPLAEQGVSVAMHSLGYMYDEGLGVTKDNKQAFKYYKLAAEAGYLPSMHNLGVKLVKGEGVRKNIKKALKWFNRAAELGYPESLFSLGLFYQIGSNGIKINHKKAIKYYTYAAERGERRAQLSIGVMYAAGQGVRVDKVRALMWVIISKAQGESKSSVWLDRISKEMTVSQIEEAQRLSRQCQKNNYKKC